MHINTKSSSASLKGLKMRKTNEERKTKKKVSMEKKFWKEKIWNENKKHYTKKRWVNENQNFFEWMHCCAHNQTQKLCFCNRHRLKRTTEINRCSSNYLRKEILKRRCLIVITIITQRRRQSMRRITSLRWMEKSTVRK